MFYESVRAAYKAGKIEILENGPESVHVVANGLVGLQAKFLSDADLQKLRDMLSAEWISMLKGSMQDCPECAGTGGIRFVGQEDNTADLDCPWCHGHGQTFVEDADSLAPAG